MHTIFACGLTVGLARPPFTSSPVQYAPPLCTLVIYLAIQRPSCATSAFEIDQRCCDLLVENRPASPNIASYS
eukprot:5400921-Pleurochrysis_carterae.AAC.1